MKTEKKKIITHRSPYGFGFDKFIEVDEVVEFEDKDFKSLPRKPISLFWGLITIY